MKRLIELACTPLCIVAVVVVVVVVVVVCRVEQ